MHEVHIYIQRTPVIILVRLIKIAVSLVNILPGYHGVGGAYALLDQNKQEKILQL